LHYRNINGIFTMPTFDCFHLAVRVHSLSPYHFVPKTRVNYASLASFSESKDTHNLLLNAGPMTRRCFLHISISHALTRFWPHFLYGRVSAQVDKHAKGIGTDSKTRLALSDFAKFVFWSPETTWRMTSRFDVYMVGAPMMKGMTEKFSFWKSLYTVRHILVLREAKPGMGAHWFSASSNGRRALDSTRRSG